LAEFPDGLPPLLAALVESYRATGLPPAYLPKHESEEEKEEESR
jgi:hypothetical protein